MRNYLFEKNRYGFKGNDDGIPKLLAATFGWEYSEDPGRIGNDLTTNNSGCLSTLAGGSSPGPD